MQDKWRYCTKCFGLWFDGNPAKGVCPAGGAHLAGDGDYILQTDPGPDQDNWRWCHKCQGLYYNGNAAHGVCPAGGAHDVASSADYVLQFAVGVGQDNWRWCPQCQGLYYNGNATKGVCPAWRGRPGDTQHTSVVVGADYALRLIQPRVLGNAVGILNPQPPIKPHIDLVVDGSGLPTLGSGPIEVALVEGGANILPNNTKVQTDQSGAFRFTKTWSPIPPNLRNIQDGDSWTATVTIGGVSASGEVTVAIPP